MSIVSEERDTVCSMIEIENAFTPDGRKTYELIQEIAAEALRSGRTSLDSGIDRDGGSCFKQTPSNPSACPLKTLRLGTPNQCSTLAHTAPFGRVNRTSWFGCAP